MYNLLRAKPSHHDWLHWSQVVIDRMTACAHIYAKPPYDDIFMSERERQDKNTATIDLLRRIHKLHDDAETPTGSLAEVAQHDEQVIAGLALLFRETLDMLPRLSADMQKLLKSHWYDGCNGRAACDLFRGPEGIENEGIGSGHPEGGRLPAILQDMLEREAWGETREPRTALQRPRDPHSHAAHDNQRRWADMNSRAYRSAGRVD